MKKLFSETILQILSKLDEYNNLFAYHKIFSKLSRMARLSATSISSDKLFTLHKSIKTQLLFKKIPISGAVLNIKNLNKKISLKMLSLPNF